MKNSRVYKLYALSLMFISAFLTGCKKGNSGKMDSNSIGYQLNMPSKGEEVANISTNYGMFKVRFFPDAAPKAVENFKELSKNGYYNGIRFHRVIQDFMIQGGDPQGNGTGGESIWGEDFEDEFSSNLLNITGAVSMANRGPNTNGSQFFVNYQDPNTFPGWDHFSYSYDVYLKNPSSFNSKYGSTVNMSKITDEVKKLYEKYGGNPNLDGYYSTENRGHTVFGQVFEGLDVVEKISKAKTDENNKPVEDIKIEYVSIESYDQ